MYLLACLQNSKKYCTRMSNKWNFSFDDYCAAVLALQSTCLVWAGAFFSTFIILSGHFIFIVLRLWSQGVLAWMVTCSGRGKGRYQSLRERERESRREEHSQSVISLFVELCTLTFCFQSLFNALNC